MAGLCQTFMNVSNAAYKPLACKTDVVTTRVIGNTGKANKAEFFFLTKPNTIRERATVDLLYPTPAWLKRALQKGVIPPLERITVGGFQRITTLGFIRVLAG